MADCRREIELKLEIDPADIAAMKALHCLPHSPARPTAKNYERRASSCVSTRLAAA
jgi:hypothetical protein